MPNPEIFQLLAAVIGSIASLIFSRRAKHETEPPPPTHAESISERIELLRENLAESSNVIDEINAELQVQITALEKIRAEAEQNQRLAELNAEAAAAVRNLVANTIEVAQADASKRDSRKQRWYFYSGLALAVPLAVVANFLYAFMTH